MKRKILVSLIFVLILTLTAACASPTAVPSTVPSNTTSTPVNSATPTIAVPQNITPIINQFVQQNSIDPTTVNYVSSEQLDWPDGCLGVVKAGYMCTMMVTPGYRIMINVNGLTIELHTNLDGTVILLAPLSTAAAQPLYLDWIDELTPCTEAQVSDQTLYSGACSQTLNTKSALTDAQKAQLTEWIRTYSSFVAITSAGTLAFYGQGSQSADSTVQNSIASWLDDTIEGSNASTTGHPRISAVSWSRSGGIAGFCDQMTISTSGVVSALSCKSNVTPQPETMLTQAQMDQLNTWLAMYQPTQIVQTDHATADSMTVTLDFVGIGSQVMPDEVKAQLMSYASEVFSTFH